LKTACKRLKTEYEVLKANYHRDMTDLATAYQKICLAERSRLSPELRYLLDQIEEDYQG
jgi:hypothetical protein